MRLIDDKIVYAINQSIPTTSFKGQSDAKQNCKELHETVSYNLIWIREGYFYFIINTYKLQKAFTKYYYVYR